MTYFEVRDTDGKIHRMPATDGLAACERVADLHGVTAIAWRESKDVRDSVIMWPVGRVEG